MVPDSVWDTHSCPQSKTCSTRGRTTSITWLILSTHLFASAGSQPEALRPHIGFPMWMWICQSNLLKKTTQLLVSVHPPNTWSKSAFSIKVFMAILLLANHCIENPLILCNIADFTKIISINNWVQGIYIQSQVKFLNLFALSLLISIQTFWMFVCINVWKIKYTIGFSNIPLFLIRWSQTLRDLKEMQRTWVHSIHWRAFWYEAFA